MMFPDFQRWRALAYLDNGNTALVFLGEFDWEIHQLYRKYFFKVFNAELAPHVWKIVLQYYSGSPERGKWLTRALLKLPAATQRFNKKGSSTHGGVYNSRISLWDGRLPRADGESGAKDHQEDVQQPAHPDDPE